MRSISASPARALAQVELLKSRKVILDIGAGPGIHLCEMLKSNGDLYGILYDLSNVISITKSYLEKEGLLSRTDLIVGDMFMDAWPFSNSKGERVDTIFMSQILHDWDLDTGYSLIAKAYNSLESGGCLLVHEKLLNSTRTGPLATAMVSVDMLFWTQGQQYSGEKLQEMMEKAGFVNFFSIPTTGYWSLSGAYKL
jgi:ribosomal protein RSM22 (predicted rRNA methylase)